MSLISVEADGGRFLLETRGDRIHSSRLAALNDNVVSSLLADMTDDIIGEGAASVLAGSYAGFGGERLRRSEGNLSCGHLVFCDETGLQAFSAVSMCMYYAAARTCLDVMREIARAGGDAAPKTAATRMRGWGLYPYTERVILMIAFGDFVPSQATLDHTKLTPQAFGANPAHDRPWFAVLNEYLVWSNEQNQMDPTGQLGVEGAYGKPRFLEHQWNTDYWIDALSRIIVMNRPLAPKADDQQKMADYFNGTVRKDNDGNVVVVESPIYDVLIANQIAYEGIDLQTRTCAIHHLDLPWEPATFTQRNGRALRQGNELRGVAIYAYLTEGTVDFYKLGRLEGRRAWLESILSSKGGASASIGGMSQKERDDITLACTLPDDRDDKRAPAPGDPPNGPFTGVVTQIGVRTRLAEQQRALRERNLVMDFVQNRQSVAAVRKQVRLIRAHMPLVMAPRAAFRFLGVNNTPLGHVPALLKDMRSQRDAVGAMKQTSPEDSIPAFTIIRATGQVRTSPALSALVQNESMVDSFTGGGDYLIPDSPAMLNPDDPDSAREVAESVAASLCEGSLVEFKRTDGAVSKRWVGKVDEGPAYSRSLKVFLSRERDGVVYGWSPWDADKAAALLLSRLAPVPIPPQHVLDKPGTPPFLGGFAIVPNAPSDHAALPAVAPAVAVYLAQVIQSHTSESGAQGFQKDASGKRYFPLFGLRWYTPVPVSSGSAGEKGLMALRGAPPLWLDANRTALRTVLAASLWRVITDPNWIVFSELGGAAYAASRKLASGLFEVFEVTPRIEAVPAVSAVPAVDAIPAVPPTQAGTAPDGTPIPATPGSPAIPAVPGTPAIPLKPAVAGSVRSRFFAVGTPGGTNTVSNDDKARRHLGSGAPLFTVSANSGNVAENAQLLSDPFGHVVDWKNKVVTPDVIDATVALGALFLRSELLRIAKVQAQGADAEVIFSEADYDPGLAPKIRARLDAVKSEVELTLLREGSAARRLWDSASVGAQGVTFKGIVHLDKTSGQIVNPVFRSLDDFFDRIRDPRGNALDIEADWPVTRFLRPLLSGVFSDVRDFVTLARTSEPVMGASKNALLAAWVELAGSTDKWTEPALLADSPRQTANVKADAARAEQRRQEEAERKAAQGHLNFPTGAGRGGFTGSHTFKVGGDKNVTIKTQQISFRRLYDFFTEAKQQQKSPVRVVLNHEGRLWLPLEVRDVSIANGVPPGTNIQIDMAPIRRGRRFPTGGDGGEAFIRYVAQMGGTGVYADVQAGKDSVEFLADQRTSLQGHADVLMEYVGQ